MNDVNKRRKNTKRITLISLTGFFIILIMFFGTNIQATPERGDTHSSGSCHPGSPGSITISSPNSSTVEVDPSSTFSITVNMTGTTKIVLFIKDNPEEINDFTITPGTTDNDRHTINLNDVVISVTVPAVEKAYVLIVAASDGVGNPANWIEFTISVGGATLPGPDVLGMIFDHVGIWLGIPALFLITLGTILVWKNENKYVKIHGILAGGAFVITLINVIVTVANPISWWTSFDIVYHLPHIILGAVGLLAGFFSMLFGIAAERKYAKITGYTALICWWAAFFLGLMLNPAMFTTFGTDFMSLFGG